MANALRLVLLHVDELVIGAVAADSLADGPDDQGSAEDSAASSTDNEDPNNCTKAIKCFA